MGTEFKELKEDPAIIAACGELTPHEAVQLMTLIRLISDLDLLIELLDSMKHRNEFALEHILNQNPKARRIMERRKNVKTAAGLQQPKGE